MKGKELRDDLLHGFNGVVVQETLKVTAIKPTEAYNENLLILTKKDRYFIE